MADEGVLVNFKIKFIFISLTTENYSVSRKGANEHCVDTNSGSYSYSL
jgi:hypothetical protein